MFKTSTSGLKTSSQVCWPLVNCTINQRLLHARCTTQLRDVRGLPLPVRRSSKPVSCTFLDNFLFLFISSSYQKIPESVAEHYSLLIPIGLKSKLFLLQYQFEIFTSYLLTEFTWQWRHVYVMNKKVNSLFLERVFIPVSRHVKLKVIKIHKDFPELWAQMYCHLFYGSCVHKRHHCWHEVWYPTLCRWLYTVPYHRQPTRRTEDTWLGTALYWMARWTNAFRNSVN